MTPTLSTPEQDRLSGALRALLSPLDGPDVDHWRREVTRSVRALFGADRAAFLLPLRGIEPVHGEGVPAGVVAEGVERLRPLDARWSVWERAARLGAYSRPLVFQAHLDEYYRSDYYRGFVLPNRLHDGIGLAVPLRGRPGAGTVANLRLWYDGPEGARDAERALALLRYLLPAFRAGVETCGRLADHRVGLARTLDSLGEGLALLDARGTILHQTPALCRILDADPEGVRLRGEMGETGRLLATLSAASGAVPDAGSATTASREVRTGAARYRLRASLAGGDVLAGGAAVLVRLERSAPEPPGEERVWAQLGLSRREAEVASLLIRGKSNEEIGKALVISPHTARHHTERVLCKAGVHSRAELAQRVRPIPDPGR